MTHITLSKTTNSKPSLEFYSDGSGELRRIAIERFPFRIGRTESADLRIESVEVSREHAEIIERNGMWLVRDLGSTNGTQVNGRPIKEMLLGDGDLLKVAETELTFIASAASQFQRMVTQPIQSKKERAATNTLPPEVTATRMMTEATLWQAIPADLRTAMSLRLRRSEAFFAGCGSTGHRQPHGGLCREVGERYRELARRKAIDQAIDRADASRLFLAVATTEIDSPHRLFSSLKQLPGLLPAGWELGITLSLPIDVDVLRIAEVYHEARDHGLLIAFDEFQGNGGQVMHLKSHVPDYLVLAVSMTKDLTSTRQPLRRLESLRAACEELMISPVLPHSDSGQVLALCQEIGFDLMLQPTARPMPAPRAQLSITV